MKRDIERFEFEPESVATVIAWMGILDEAGDGWMNLLPGLVDESTGATTELLSGFSALLGKPATTSTMATYLPSKRGDQPGIGATIGILHPLGGHGVDQLRAAGLAVSATWKVRQDHARRGIVLELPAGVPHAEIVSWLLEAGTKLCRDQLTGMWQAVVYCPKIQVDV